MVEDDCKTIFDPMICETPWVILLKKAQDGFGIFWKKKKFSFQFFYSKVLR